MANDGLNLDALKKKYESVSKSLNNKVSDINWYNPTVDVNNVIRILPPWKNGASFYKETYYHYNVGERSFACPAKMEGKPCPICEFVEKLKRSSDPDDQELASSLWPKARFFYNVIDRNDESAGVKVYGSGIMVFKEILSYMIDPDWGPQLVDPKIGYDIKIEKTGKNIDTRYKVKARKEPSAISNSAWLDQLYDLDSIAKIESYDALAAALEGKDIVESKSSNDKVKTPSSEVATSSVKKDEDEFSSKASSESEPKRTPVKEEKKEDPVPTKSSHAENSEAIIAKLKKLRGNK